LSFLDCLWPIASSRDHVRVGRRCAIIHRFVGLLSLLSARVDEGSMRAMSSAHRIDECMIEWWRGYVRSSFFALVEPLGAGGDGVLESGRFWSLGKSSLKQDGRVAAAHQRLVEELLQQGWEPAGVGAVWYQQRFRRREAVPSMTRIRPDKVEHPDA